MRRASLWRAAEPRALAWREWDGEFVVYNDATGSTHHLSALGGDVLRTLLAHAAGIEMAALVREIAQRVETSEHSALPAEVERTLAQLAELRLAACASA
jgi:PqqD family protein of HPr-rel-A system